MKKIRTVFAVKHKNETIRAASRSGGVFTAISDIVLENGGVVYGCALNDDFLAEHRRAKTKEERNEFRGSKYIQSDICDTYNQAKNDLRNGLTVLFSGTSCQIDGLYNYLSVTNTDVSNLITIDIVCHGVPSPMVWSDFLKAISNNQKIQKVDFRNKTDFGWRDHTETITIGNEAISSKTYKNLFFSHLIVRPSCFHCNYKSVNRVSDVTIGDYWLIELLDKSFDDDKGVSLVMLNSEKGRKYFDMCKEKLVVKEFPLAISVQPALARNYSVPDERDEFWNEYSSDNLLQLISKYTSSN